MMGVKTTIFRAAVHGVTGTLESGSESSSESGSESGSASCFTARSSCVREAAKLIAGFIPRIEYVLCRAVLFFCRSQLSRIARGAVHVLQAEARFTVTSRDAQHEL